MNRIFKREIDGFVICWKKSSFLRQDTTDPDATFYSSIYLACIFPLDQYDYLKETIDQWNDGFGKGNYSLIKIKKKIEIISEEMIN